MLVLDAIDVFVTCCWEPLRMYNRMQGDLQCCRGKLCALHRGKVWMILEYNIAVSIGWGGYV
jgi:hypothetical protein